MLTDKNSTQIVETLIEMANDAHKNAPNSIESALLTECAHRAYTVATGAQHTQKDYKEAHLTLLQLAMKGRRAFETFMEWEKKKARVLGAA